MLPNGGAGRGEMTLPKHSDLSVSTSLSKPSFTSPESGKSRGANSLVVSTNIL